MCAAALQLLVSVFLYTSIVSRPVEFVKWPVAADRSHLVHPEAPGFAVCSGVPFSSRLVALWYVWGMVWVVSG